MQSDVPTIIERVPTWYQFLKDFAPTAITFLTAFVAIVVNVSFNRRSALNAERDVTISSEKLRLDLYERRFSIFVSIFDLYEIVIGWSNSPDQHLVRAKFLRAHQEAFFLFPKKSGIYEILTDIKGMADKVIGFKSIERDLFNGGGDEYYRRQREMNYIVTTGFEQALNSLRLAISDYIVFNT
ncbi:hypothetical protein [Nitrospirillum pindoramense]|uniref:hypothetical protein n=1 Tax=Nitrospirillum amazonense TaxID=28077 RepID=UPI0011A3F288|nr:hypothetical protein [Nitrospirillum amazonense]